MTSQSYIQRLRSAMSERGFTEEHISACCAYSSALLSHDLPVLFDARHVDKVLHLHEINPEAYHTFTIPQVGKLRTITAPGRPLKQRQRWILQEILSKVDSSEYAHGFEPERSIKTNALLHANSQYVLCMDIKDFFPSILYDSIVNVFRSIGYSPSASLSLADLCSYHKVLPQGAPTSPKLANIIFKPLDEKLAAIAKEENAIYSRYADDLTFSGDHDLKCIIDRVSQLLEGFGFRLNEEKIHSYGPNFPKRITGLVVQNGTVRVPKHFKRTLRQEIHYCLKYGVLTHLENTKSVRFINYREHLYGKAYFINMVEPQEGKLYLSQLDQIEWPSNFIV